MNNEESSVTAACALAGSVEQDEAAGLTGWDAVTELLESASIPFGSAKDLQTANKRKHSFPGAVLLVGQGGKIIYHKATGCRSIIPAQSSMTTDTVFDVSSLTKALVTTTLTMQMVDKGLLSVDSRLSRIFQTFGTLGKERMSVRHLLTHSSGYPATMPFYKAISRADKGERWGIMTSRGAVEMVYSDIFRSKLEHVPGKVCAYSDVGFILLGAILEVCSGGQTLDKLAVKNIFKPLGLRSSGFVDISKMKRRGLTPVSDIIAPTLECPWRGKLLCGEVHDDNAWAMGGIAGHAGLFSTAYDIHQIAVELLHSYHGRSGFVSQETIRKFWTRDGGINDSTWALGWDTPSKESSSAGKLFPRSGVGHLGYTGCSIWIDPEREIDVILLSNRIHPNDQNLSIREFRPAIHDLVMKALGE